MGIVHNVEISWEELLNAFTSGLCDRVYFLDKLTGEIFFVSSHMEDEEFWNHVESHQERFLEIPRFDLRVERQIMARFITATEDNDLRAILENIREAKNAYGKLDDILEFFPSEQEKLVAMKDDFLSNRMKTWLEEHNLFTGDLTISEASRP